MTYVCVCYSESKVVLAKHLMTKQSACVLTLNCVPFMFGPDKLVQHL